MCVFNCIIHIYQIGGDNVNDLGNKSVMAANIKRMMRKNGINAKELSKALGEPYSTVLSWAKGDYYPRIDKIEKMAEYFGCLKSDLIEDKAKQPAESELSEVKQALIDLVDSLSEGEAAVLLASLKSQLGR